MPAELDNNQRKVLNAFRVLGPASNADVARHVALTHPAVAQIVRKLCAANYLRREEEKRRLPRGQPATLYAISDRRVFVGIHVGRAQLELVGVDLAGNAKASRRVDVGFLDRQRLEALCQVELDRFLRRSSFAAHEVAGVGIATPDFWEGWRDMLGVDGATDRDWNAHAVTGLFRFPDGLPVRVGNDGSAAALAELTFGSGAAHRDFLYVNIGTFIGGGLVIDGALRTGAHGNSAALGPYPVSPSSLQPPGHERPFQPLLARASLHALAAHAERRDADLDLVDWDDPDEFDRHEAVAEWIDDCAGALAEFFIGVWSLIDVEAIILDGALSRPLLRHIAARAEARSQRFGVEGVIPAPIKLGKLGTAAQSVGAACLPILADLGPPPTRGD